MNLKSPEEDFITGISHHLLESSHIPTAILAGHRILSQNGEYSQDLGVFPEVTWNIGLEIVESVKEKMGHIGIFTVINDWAKLRGMPDADEIRENYWGDPQYELLEAIDVSIYQPHILNGIGFGGIVKRGRFSEKALQNRFSRLFPRKREACDGPSCEYSFNKCSSEVVMIARELYTVGIRRLVSLMPNICKNPISYASHSLARGEFTLSDGILSEGFTMETFYMTCFQTETIQDVLSNHEKERISIPPSL